jgi:hypothetical protein
MGRLSTGIVGSQVAPVIGIGCRFCLRDRLGARAVRTWALREWWGRAARSKFRRWRWMRGRELEGDAPICAGMARTRTISFALLCSSSLVVVVVTIVSSYTSTGHLGARARARAAVGVAVRVEAVSLVIVHDKQKRNSRVYGRLHEEAMYRKLGSTYSMRRDARGR